jgi:hypothetical protein
MSKENPNLSDLSVKEDSFTSKKIAQELKIDLLKNPSLLDMIVGLSASESDNLLQLGLSNLHLNDLIIEINRYLLASGASVAYGGDLRVGGITEILIELVDQYKFANQAQSDRLRSYLAFPISLSLTEENQAQYAHRIKFTKVPPPDDVKPIDEKTFIPPEGIENSYIWSRSLTHMRELMESECHARIFIGGRSKNYKGIAPGVLEEIIISLKSETPLFLIGGYGGVTLEVVGHLNDCDDLINSLSEISKSQSFLEMNQAHEDRDKKDIMHWPEQLLQLLEKGWQRVSDLNGLTIEDNKTLAKSVYVDEITYYLLKGLTNLSQRN